MKALKYRGMIPVNIIYPPAYVKAKYKDAEYLCASEGKCYMLFKYKFTDDIYDPHYDDKTYFGYEINGETYKDKFIGTREDIEKLKEESLNISPKQLSLFD